MFAVYFALVVAAIAVIVWLLIKFKRHVKWCFGTSVLDWLNIGLMTAMILVVWLYMWYGVGRSRSMTQERWMSYHEESLRREAVAIKDIKDYRVRDSLSRLVNIGGHITGDYGDRYQDKEFRSYAGYSNRLKKLEALPRPVNKDTWFTKYPKIRFSGRALDDPWYPDATPIYPNAKYSNEFSTRVNILVTIAMLLFVFYRNLIKTDLWSGLLMTVLQVISSILLIAIVFALIYLVLILLGGGKKREDRRKVDRYGS